MRVSVTDIGELLRQTSARDFDGDDTGRLATIKEAQRLIHRLQHPTERGWELAFENWAVLGTLQTFIDLGIFERWHAGGGGQMSLKDLCELARSDVDPKLVGEYCSLLSHLYENKIISSSFYLNPEKLTPILRKCDCAVCWQPKTSSKRLPRSSISQPTLA